MLCGLRRKQLSDDLDTDVRDHNKSSSKSSKKRKKSEGSREEEFVASEVEKSRLRKEIEHLRHKNKELNDLKDHVSDLRSDNGALQRQNRELKENNRVLTNLLKGYEIKCEECLVQADCYLQQIEQLTESETSLQSRLAAQIQMTEDHVKDKTNYRETVKALQGEASETASMKKIVKCQERSLLEKTHRIINLENSLKSITDGLKAQLNYLQDIPEAIISNNKKLQVYINRAADRLSDSLEKSSKQTLDKLDALENAWGSFRDMEVQLDTHEGRYHFGTKNIPSWLKDVTRRLSCTLGPNWLDAGRALGLDGHHLERILVTWGQYGMRELAVQTVEMWCGLTPETDISLETLHNALGQLEIDPFLVEPMSEHDQRLLTENYQALVEDMMDVTLIEGYLRQAHLLSAAALDYVLTPRTRQRRVQRLLKVLRFCGSRALSVFRDALIKSGQPILAMELTGEDGLEADRGGERDITQDVLTGHMERRHTQEEVRMDTMAELQTYLLRVAAETKKEVLLVREHMEKGIFRSSQTWQEPSLSRAPSSDLKFAKTM